MLVAVALEPGVLVVGRVLAVRGHRRDHGQREVLRPRVVVAVVRGQVLVGGLPARVGVHLPAVAGLRQVVALHEGALELYLAGRRLEGGAAPFDRVLEGVEPLAGLAGNADDGQLLELLP